MTRPLPELIGLALETLEPDEHLQCELAERFHELNQHQQMMILENPAWRKGLGKWVSNMRREIQGDFYACLQAHRMKENGEIQSS